MENATFNVCLNYVTVTSVTDVTVSSLTTGATFALIVVNI